MNEIQLPAFRSGATLTYEALQPNGAIRTPEGTSLPEILSTGYYTADDANVQSGDIIVIKEGSTVVGGGIYGVSAIEQIIYRGPSHPQPHSIFGF